MASITLRPARLPDERRFYMAMTLALLATVLAGFSRSFYVRPLFPDHPSPSEAVFYWHGAVFTAWFLLLISQSVLISTGRVAVHRALGRAGGVLAGVMIVFGSYVALVASAREGGFIEVPIPPLNFLVIPLADMLIFGTLAGIAIAKRNVAQTHKRLMLIASISIIDAAVARLPFDFIEAGGPLVFFGVQDLFLLAIVIWDFASRGRLHPATLWGSVLLVVSQPIRLWISSTEGWLAFAAAAVELVK